MAGDPFKIFAAERESKRETLKMLWPELYECLARLDAPQSERAIGCVLGSCPHTKPVPPAVGRITRNGHPACRAHIAKLADRVGGWPLGRESS